MMIGGLYLSNILVCKNESRQRLVIRANDERWCNSEAQCFCSNCTTGGCQY